MIVRVNAKKNKESFPVEIILNCGPLYFTDRAAVELRDKLDKVIKERAEVADEGKPHA
jgi:hypothetical protein